MAALLEVTVEVNGAPRVIAVQRPTLGDLADIEAAQDSGKLRDILPVMARVLGLPMDELRGIYPEDLKTIMDAVAQVNNVPLASA